MGGGREDIGERKFDLIASTADGHENTQVKKKTSDLAAAGGQKFHMGVAKKKWKAKKEEEGSFRKKKQVFVKKFFVKNAAPVRSGVFTRIRKDGTWLRSATS